MTVATEFEKDNAKYASSFSKGDLALPPARKVVVIVCMDARIDPAAALGLSEGDAHVICSAYLSNRRSFGMLVAVPLKLFARLLSVRNFSGLRKLWSFIIQIAVCSLLQMTRFVLVKSYQL
jgi:hypothetical protein